MAERDDILYLLIMFIALGFFGATAIYDIFDVDFGMPKGDLETQEEEILFKYNDGNFALYPNYENESYILPANTKLNISIIKLSKYDNMIFVNLTMPDGISYKYMRGFISGRCNRPLVLSWRD